MSTPSDQPLPSAPKSPLSGASIPPAPAPAPGFGSAADGAGLTKPAFKVTRSPFAPKISGSGALGSASASAAPATPARPPARKHVSATGNFTSEEKPAMVLLDFVAAAVAIAAAVMMALAYFKK